MSDKKQTKPGKVIRIPKDLLGVLKAEREQGETWGQVIKRLIKEKPDSLSMWTLPSKLLPTKAEARGLAIAEAVEGGLDLDHAEQPIKVFELDDE